MELDFYTLIGRYYELPCCGWRKQAGRSQPGDWHISAGDEVKAAFKLLYTHTNTHTHVEHLHTHTIHCKRKYIQIARERYTWMEREREHSC